jgi:hypothetical protein
MKAIAMRFGAAWTLALVALLLGVALLAPSTTQARGGAETAVYVNDYDSAGYVRIQGDGFTIGGEVEIWVYDDSWGWAAAPSDYQVVEAYRYDYWTSCDSADPTCISLPMTTGLIDLFSGPYCPRFLSIYAHDVATGVVVSTEYRSTECPW